MKFAVVALVANVSAITLSKPLIHPQTGLAITTTGQHWYGQPPLAMAEEEPAKKEAAPVKKDAPAKEGDDEEGGDAAEDLNIYSSSFRGPGHLFPLKPKAPKFSVKFPVEFDNKGYPLPEKVHTLSPELHMEYNNLDVQYKFPRTAFYL